MTNARWQMPNAKQSRSELSVISQLSVISHQYCPANAFLICRNLFSVRSLIREMGAHDLNFDLAYSPSLARSRGEGVAYVCWSVRLRAADGVAPTSRLPRLRPPLSRRLPAPRLPMPRSIPLYGL